jgi:hypothetical protein
VLLFTPAEEVPMLRSVTIQPSGRCLPVPRGGLLTQTYQIGRFQLAINQRVDRPPVMKALTQMQVWKPWRPTWEALSRQERTAYRRARDSFAQAVADITGKEVVVLESGEVGRKSSHRRALGG